MNLTGMTKILMILKRWKKLWKWFKRFGVSIVKGKGLKGGINNSYCKKRLQNQIQNRFVFLDIKR